MKIDLMRENQRSEILKFLVPYEKFCVTLFSQIMCGSTAVYVISDGFGIIYGVFSFYHASMIHHCLPKLNGNNRKEIQTVLTDFFCEAKVKNLYCIAGEASGSEFIENCIFTACGKKPFSKNPCLLMERNPFSLETQRVAALPKTQLKFSKCNMDEIDYIFRIQYDYEIEEVAVDGMRYDENSSYARFENLVEDGAVFLGKIQNVCICKASVNCSTKNYALIGGVYTVPKYRRHGFGTAMIAYMANVLNDIHKKSILFVKVKNKTATDIYARVGFKKICNYSILYYQGG